MKTQGEKSKAPDAITFGLLALLVKEGTSTMHAYVTRSGNGYQLVVFKMTGGSYVLHSERSKKPRNFKTIDAACGVCSELGFDTVYVKV